MRANLSLQIQIKTLFDSLRGVARIEDLINALSAAALLKKIDINAFTHLVNLPLVDLDTNLQKSFNLQLEYYPFDSAHIPSLPSQAWQSIFLWLNQFTSNHIDLAQALRFECSQDRGYMESGLSESVAGIMAALAGSTKNQVIYDSCAGLACIASLFPNANLQLEERISAVQQLSARLLLLESSDLDSIEYRCSNSLTESAFEESAKADQAIITPPMGVRFSPQEAAVIATQAYICVQPDGKLPTSAADSVWIQQALHQVSDTGRVIVMLAQGVLFRGGYYEKTREHLINNNLIESIISLPDGLLGYTQLAPIILVLNKNKPAEQPIHMVNASSLGEKKGRQKFLSQLQIDRVKQLSQGQQPDDPIYRAVSLSDIREASPDNISGNQLQVGQFFIKEEIFELPDEQLEQVRLVEAQQRFEQAQYKLNQLLGLPVGEK